MNLNKKSWYVRWFFWSLGILQEFIEYPAWKYQQRTNLCHFVRVVLAYAPLALFLNLVFYAAAIGVVTVWPIYLFGAVVYGKFLLVTIVPLAVLCVVVALINGWLENRADTVVSRPQVVKAVNTEPTFRQVVGEWFKAKKAKVCPLITFTDSKEVTNA